MLTSYRCWKVYFELMAKSCSSCINSRLGLSVVALSLSLHMMPEPYLKASKQVSKEPLALVVFCRSDEDVHTMLPHRRVTVPCRCKVNNEPILAEAILVQIGGMMVEKFAGTQLVNIDSPEVVTLKINVFRDEFADQWEVFCRSPIRSIVHLIPELKRCHEDGCTCQCWHNVESLPIKEPILDLWRRQFLKHGYKQAEPSKADFFTVFVRVPVCLLTKVLGRSGIGGVYVEPRSADGRTVLTEYMVIWAGKHSLKDLLHLRQTNPAVAGLARVGERRGLRVAASQAQEVHQIVKPDTLFLPQGDRVQYLVGPFPFGTDRQGISRAMRQAGWSCKPLQPSTPQPRSRCDVACASSGGAAAANCVDLSWGNPDFETQECREPCKA